MAESKKVFLIGMSGVGVENFDSQTLGVFPTSLSFAPTSVTATASTTDPTNHYVTNGMPFGTFATSGTQFLFETGNDSLGLNDTVTFSASVAGVGMYLRDANLMNW